MPILVVFTLVPTLTFYFYVLVQFWREANRRRHQHDTCMTIVRLHSARARELDYNLRHQSERDSRANSVVAASPAARPAGAKILAMYLKDRLAVLPPATGRVAAKRAAKG